MERHPPCNWWYSVRQKGKNYYSSVVIYDEAEFIHEHAPQAFPQETSLPNSVSLAFQH